MGMCLLFLFLCDGTICANQDGTCPQDLNLDGDAGIPVHAENEFGSSPCHPNLSRAEVRKFICPTRYSVTENPTKGRREEGTKI